MIPVWWKQKLYTQSLTKTTWIIRSVHFCSFITNYHNVLDNTSWVIECATNGNHPLNIVIVLWPRKELRNPNLTYTQTQNAHARSGVIFIHSINAVHKSVHRKSLCRNYRFFHTKCDLQYDKSCLLQERWSDTPLPITRRCFYAVCRRRWTPRMSGKRISQVSPQSELSDTIIMLCTSSCEYKSGGKGIRVLL